MSASFPIWTNLIENKCHVFVVGVDCEHGLSLSSKESKTSSKMIHANLNINISFTYKTQCPPQVSESLVVNHGDFLIRDSQSSQGDFVLTNHWEQKTLHFVIRRTAVQSSETYTRVRFGLEGEAFDSLPALVHFYVGSKEALTRWSGARIHRPVNRTLPLSYLETAFCTAVGPPSCKNGGVSGEEKVCPRR